jgi:diguanylate cyclase (GGDEF)-like protein
MSIDRARVTQIYIASTGLLALATLGLAAAVPQHLEWSWWGVGLLFAGTMLAEVWAVPLPRAGAVSVSTMLHIVAVLLLPPPVAALVAGAAMLATQVGERAPLNRLIFNTSSATLTVGLTGILANHFGLLERPLGDGGALEIVAFFGLAAANYLINDLLVTGIAALSTGEPFGPMLIENSRYSAPAEIAVTVIGGLLALVWVRAPFWLPAALFPALISQLTFKYIDATARRSAELEHRAAHDHLTDLPNRVHLHDRLREQILVNEQTGQPFALLMIDLDRFKDVNDTFGHTYGDRLLREIGPRFSKVLRPDDTIARLGGDEFAVLLPDTSVDDASRIAERLAEVLREPFVLDEYVLDVGASIGVAVCAEHGDTPDALVRRADVAMYVAKRGGDEYAVYSTEQDGHSVESLALIGELRGAIADEQLVLHYQPKVDFATGELVGVEALVRWQHPRRGLLPPAEFISLAEHTGLIRPLGEWVLCAALRQQHAWRAAGLRIPVAVNLSTHNLNDRLVDSIAGLLAGWQTPADQLHIEITESSLMAELDRTLEVLTRVHDMGVRISIDDFGTGYSSLSRLKRWPIDELKVDRSFVENMVNDDHDTAIVRATITLAHDLGLSVVAEGMEDEATWNLLAALGCDVAQGYFMARPMPPQQLLAWSVARQRIAPAA